MQSVGRDDLQRKLQELQGQNTKLQQENLDIARAASKKEPIVTDEVASSSLELGRKLFEQSVDLEAKNLEIRRLSKKILDLEEVRP